METKLEMAERHVSAGERHVDAQRGIIARLARVGASTKLAEELLIQFEDTLRQHRAHRDLLAAEAA